MTPARLLLLIGLDGRIAWAGIEALGAVLIGTPVLGGPATMPRIGSALLILAGIVGLNADSKH